MKTLYFECGMGAAGDMIMSALLELIDDQEGFIARMNGLGLPGIKLAREKIRSYGIAGTHIKVTYGGFEEEEASAMGVHFGGPHSHMSLNDIEHVIRSHLEIPNEVKQDALQIFSLIAEAESHAHDMPIDQIHFHEVGTADAIADIVGACMLVNEIAPDRICASPVHVGSGEVRCAHGVLPVPAPATAYILQGVQTYGGSVQGELCTPTGASILKHFAKTFGAMPMMAVDKIGYGMGSKDFGRLSCVRAILGESEDERDRVWELTCNVDDMTPEAVGFAMEKFFECGALEAYTVPINMKKTRPGLLICVMCREDEKEAIVRCIFKHTTTIGLRESTSARYVLDREIDEIQTELGPVRVKRSTGYGVCRSKFEYDDIVRAARKHQMSLSDVIARIKDDGATGSCQR